MIVETISVGSLWLSSNRDPRTAWNTTGVPVNGRLDSRAKPFGLVRFPAREVHRLLASAGFSGARWMASAPSSFNGTRTIHLYRRAAKHAAPNWFLVAITEGLVGKLDEGSWSPDVASLLSFSEYGGKQEALLLVRAFGWIRGTGGFAVLVPTECGSVWEVER